MKKGINSEYDSLRQELYELKVKLKTELNVDKEEINKRVEIILNRMKQLELENIKGGKEK